MTTSIATTRRAASLRRARLVAAGLFAALETLAALPAAALESVLVAEGSPMSYRANTSDPGLGTAWTAEAFVPSGWTAGTYGVGYETDTGAEALLATTTATGASSVYTRAEFTIDNLASVASVHLAADWDDGYVAWINGVEVFRSSQMPVGAPAWNSVAVSHESSNNAAPSYGTINDVTAAALGALHAGTNVLAVGAWNTSSASSDLVLVPRLSINRDNAVTRGPYLQLGTPTSTVVRWRTLAATDSCVRYGTTAGSLVDQACAGSSVTEHVITVTGLAPATRYYYSVGSSVETMAGGTSDDFFTTAPVAGTPTPTRVWVLGDSGTADASAAAVRDAYLSATAAAPADLLLMLGDNAYNSGTDTEYQQAVFETYPSVLRNTVLWPTLGNHDGITADSATQSGAYYDIFTLPAAAQAGGVVSGTEAYWSFDYGDVHFICLESYETDRSPGGAMMTWLAADLADTTANWIIAFFHHPPYSKGSHDSDTEAQLVQMRTNALPLLEAGGVDLVLAGHSHSYERSFLLDGHYGLSGTLTPAMKLDAGSGRDGDTGAYAKPGGGPVANEGAVYVTAGSSGQVDAGPLNHPAMFLSVSALGSMVLDVDGNRLDATFLDDGGTAVDTFSLVKIPPPPTCGDGVAEAPEECDDANASDTDACLSDCTAASCGDGFVQVGVEQCDDANADNGDGCLDTCVLTSCGDGFVQVGVEECDDANASDTDACLSTCHDATCGDGFVRTGVEDCDDANADDTDACLAGCVAASCGDGFLQAGVEACDDGNADDTDACVAGCVAAACGDGFVQVGVEECDDGNAAPGDGCDASCRVSCPPTPRGDCREAAVSKVKAMFPADPTRSQLRWNWQKGPAVSQGDLGDPTAAGTYALCYYPDVPGAGALAAETVLPAGAEWLDLAGRGFSYVDAAAGAGGVQNLRISTGDAGRSKLKVKGRGAAIPTAILATASMTLQLLDHEGGGCWSSAFPTGTATATSFKATFKAP